MCRQRRFTAPVSSPVIDIFSSRTTEMHPLQCGRDLTGDTPTKAETSSRTNPPTRINTKPKPRRSTNFRKASNAQSRESGIGSFFRGCGSRSPGQKRHSSRMQDTARLCRSGPGCTRPRPPGIGCLIPPLAIISWCLAALVQLRARRCFVGLGGFVNVGEGGTGWPPGG